MMIHRLLPLPLVASAALLGCPAGEQAPGARDGDAPAKAEDAAKAAGAVGDPAAKTAPPPQDPATATPPKPQQPPPPPSRTFRKGQTAPKGLSDDELYAFNKAQGDPTDGAFTLEMAFAGDESLADREAGKLYAIFETSMGAFSCVLFEDAAPKTVASFVGLARGKRPWYDKREDAWKSDQPFFDGVIFHRVIHNFMIQTGDRMGTGTGFPGFLIPDEIDPTLKHNKAGILSMANRGPNTGSSQFFVTVRATPHLDGKHAIFGQCEPKVPLKISEVKVKSMPGVDSRPLDDVTIQTIRVERRKG